MLHEKICDSVTLAELTGDEERLFHRIVVKADDYGRFHAIPELLLGACFPLLVEKISVEQVRMWRDRLAEVGLIELYMVDGREYLQLVTWDSYQRRRGSKPKFPAPLEGAATRRELPRVADICGSRVVKTGSREPEDVNRKTVDGSREASGEPPPTAAAAAAKKTPGDVFEKPEIPEALAPNAANYALGAKVGLSRRQVDAEALAMLAHYRAVGQVRDDWHATLGGWLRNGPRIDQPARASPSSQNGRETFEDGTEIRRVEGMTA